MPPKVETKNERVITFSVPCDARDAREIGDFIAQAAANGYALKSWVAIQEDRGSQRDPVIVTVGGKVVMAKS